MDWRFMPVKIIDTTIFYSLTKSLSILMLDMIGDDFIDPYFEYKMYAINCVKVQECILLSYDLIKCEMCLWGFRCGPHDDHFWYLSTPIKVENSNFTASYIG